MAIQGGTMTTEEVRQFEALEFGRDAVRLRRWDDAAKVVGLSTPSLDRFLQIATDCID
jgi:predicted HD phosphohydrolase